VQVTTCDPSTIVLPYSSLGVNKSSGVWLHELNAREDLGIVQRAVNGMTATPEVA
jgi:hypothetical protein